MSNVFTLNLNSRLQSWFQPEAHLFRSGEGDERQPISHQPMGEQGYHIQVWVLSLSGGR
ncbi:hypothetical protein [Serratia fonticola]